ncbi:bifunctional hydroxymethylpyrimidine kinase/phosphomethylpyrimidine kinase [Psychrobacillus sp. NPDC093180]|uniref:bifunctional hydroxymethylpyrimidine kinase/phosphomethylpyrimidine kinase n=1 Tax=Psychrobacillus sp. NPDC093180 TaxID=3364489 RepID=UPI0037F39F35
MKTVLTIAGSDSGGGAGIQADIKAISANGAFGMSVITAVTAQNTKEVRSVQQIDLNIIQDQLEAVFDDIQVDAVKIGMLGNVKTVQVVAEALKKYKPKYIVVDPVMISKGGHYLLEKSAVEALKEKILPLSSIVTPNIPEAEVLIGRTLQTEEEMYKACEQIMEMGVDAVLIKGGHLMGPPNDLFYNGVDFHWLKANRIQTKNTHGSGCTLSSAIAANLTKGFTLLEAATLAKQYITTAIKHSLSLGSGHGPTHHFYDLYESSKMGLK